jgi:hypothetical protein
MIPKQDFRCGNIGRCIKNEKVIVVAIALLSLFTGCGKAVILEG